MQKPIRYYITKRGEEPTVRSVKVALSAAEAEDRVPRDANATDPAVSAKRESLRRLDGASVRRLVKHAVRRRSPKR